MSAQPKAEYVRGFVAEEANVCVLLRSGLGRRTLMIRWDLAKDELELGQWLIAWINHGAISEDGHLFAYHVDKSIDSGNPRQIFAYSVVSRPPYFTALAFWNDRAGTERLRWLKEDSDPLIRRPDKGTLPDECRPRLGLRIDTYASSPGLRDRPPRHYRPCSAGELVLYQERLQPDFYSLGDDLFEVDWADVDHRGRLLFARAGRVYVRDAEDERELIDLNPYEFNPVKPPRWATQWPDQNAD